MIRALITGDLHADPQARTGRSGQYVTVRVSVPQHDAGRIFCSVIAFDAIAVARLLELKAGAAVSLAGTLTVSTYEARDGTTRPALDMIADEVASTTPRPRPPKATGKRSSDELTPGDPRRMES